MVETTAWKALNEGGTDASGVVLAVDFPFTGRPEAGFGDLVSKLDGGRSLWESVPPVNGAETGLTGAGYVDRWLAGVWANGWAVHAVLGYCAGSVYASSLADGLAADNPGGRPKLVLFDPETPDATTVYWQFHKVIDGLGAVLRPGEVTEAQQEGQRISQETGDLALLGERLLSVFHRAGVVAFDRVGLDAARREEFTATVSAFMSYLVAAVTIDVGAGWSFATAISSRTSMNGLNLVPPEDRPGMVAREIRFDIEHADLLRDPDVVRACTELLA
jgi:hypothetical protein